MSETLTIHDLARRLREAAPGCLIYYRLPDDEPGHSITETQGLTSREQVALAVQILMSWADDEGLDYDDVLGAMTVAQLCERMGMVEDEPVHVAASCAHCAHRAPTPADDPCAILCRRHEAVMPRTLVCAEFTPRLRVTS